MGAEVVGEAEVLITANFSTFDDELKAKLTAAAKRAGAEAERILKRSGNDAGKGFSDGIAKASGSTKTLEALRNSVQRLEQASVRAGDAQVNAAERVRSAEAALAKVRRTTSTVTLDGAEKIIAAEARVAKAQRDAARASNLATTAANALGIARARLAQEGESSGRTFIDRLRAIVNRGASDAGNSSGGFFARAFRTAAGRAIGVGLFRTLAVSAGGLLTALSPLSTLLGGATAAVVALAAALSTASGSAFALGGILGSLGVAVGALKIGFSGVGDAMKAQSAAQEELARTGEISTATQQKLDAALKNLSPSAAAVVRQLGAMAPAWRAVTQSVQERLFTGVGQSIAALGNRYLPILNSTLTTTAGTLNGATRNLASFLNTSTRAAQISSIFSGLNGILKTLLSPLSSVSGGFLDIFQKSLPFAKDLANTLSTLGANFGAFLSQSAANGSFTTFLTTATQTAQTLFRLLGNVGSIIGQVFAAGTASGGNLLKLLADITGQFSQFLRTSQGKAALAGFFGLIASAGQTLVGVFKTLQPLLAGIGTLFTELQGPIGVLGTALTGVIGQLANTLGGALIKLAPVIGQLVVAAAPLVTVLGGVLSSAIAALVPVIVSLVQSFTTLLPAITPIIQILGTALTTTLGQLSGLLVQILPVLVQLIAAFAAGLTPVLAALQPVLAQIVAAAVGLVAALLPILTSLLPLIPSVAQLGLAFTQLVVALAPLITQGLVSLTQLLVSLAPYIAQLVPPLIQLIGFFTQFTLVITKVVAAVVSFGVKVQAAFNQVAGFVARSIAAMVTTVVGLVQSLIGKFGSVMQSISSTVSSGVGKIVKFFVDLPGKIISALSGLAGKMASLGGDIVAGLANGITAKAGSVIKAAQDLASQVTGVIGKVLKVGSPSKETHKLGEFAGQGLANGILESIPAVAAAATNLANAVPKAIESSVNKLNTALNGLAKNLPSVIRTRLNQAVASARVGIASIGRAQDALDAKLKTAQSNLQGLLQKSQQLAQSVAQGILQTGNIAEGQDQSFRGLVGRLQSAVTNAKAFATVIAQLSKTALNKTSLQQIIDAGPEAGLAAGRAVLAAGNAGIRQVNTLQSQLQTAANKAAKSASDAIFGQGVRLAQGLVAGLQKQRQALDAQMLRLADVLVARVLKVLRSVKIRGAGTLDIPGFADGGVIRRDGIYRGAEKNRPEAIVPLTKPRRAQQILESTGLVGSGASKTRTVEVPIHVAGSVVDYDALTAYFEKLFARYGLKPVLGLNVAGGTL